MARLQSTGIQSSGSVASIGVAYGSNVTSGSLLVAVCVTSSVDMPAGSVVDTQGNTWAQDVILQRSTNERCAIFSTVAGATGANTVTLDPASDVMSLGIAEYSPHPNNTWSTTAATRREDTDSASISGSAPATPAMTAGAIDGVCVGGLTHGDTTETIDPGIGFETLYENENATNMPISMIGRDVGAGTYTPNWVTGAISPGGVAVGAIFKETLGTPPAEAARFAPYRN